MIPDIIKIALYWLLISIIAVIFIVRLFRHSKDPFDRFTDHDDNMDDEGEWK
jgi:hypothetical protein